nr:KH domain-containing protein [uncultured Desulfobacter sp.]
MKVLMETMVRALVDEPDFVNVTEIGGIHTSILELKVCKSDIGKVIGKKGRTADALRTILNAVSAKLNKRVFLEITEDLND